MSGENILNMTVKDWAKKQFNVYRYNQREKTVFQIQRDYQTWRDDLKFVNKSGNFQNDHFQNSEEREESDANPTKLLSLDSCDMESLLLNSGNDTSLT